MNADSLSDIYTGWVIINQNIVNTKFIKFFIVRLFVNHLSAFTNKVISLSTLLFMCIIFIYNWSY